LQISRRVNVFFPAKGRILFEQPTYIANDFHSERYKCNYTWYTYILATCSSMTGSSIIHALFHGIFNRRSFIFRKK
jgi:hypothetical protein